MSEFSQKANLIQKDEDVLEEALRITSEDRNRTYGHPAENMLTTADLWSAYLTRAHGRQTRISPEEVAIMQGLLKVARLAASPAHRDSFVDIAGWARVAWLSRPADSIDPHPPEDMRDRL